MFNKKKKNKLLKIIFGSSILTIIFVLVVMISVLMMLDFFGVNLNSDILKDNAKYSNSYKSSLNKYLDKGYVPLSRILYFYLENDDLSFDDLYLSNLNEETKNLKTIEEVCLSNKALYNMSACTSSQIEENKEYLELNNPIFSVPLQTSFTVTSHVFEERIIYNEIDNHSGWDLAVPAETDIFSVCDGVVESVNFTQKENTTYDVSGNKNGNSIRIRCNVNNKNYYIYYGHLYPESSTVSEGDEVTTNQLIAKVGTTGFSTGNHLHFQVSDDSGSLLDGFSLINWNN